MKRILIIIPNKRRYMALIFIAITLILFAAIVIKTVFFSGVIAFSRIEEQEISALEKENPKLEECLFQRLAVFATKEHYCVALAANFQFI